MCSLENGRVSFSSNDSLNLDDKISPHHTEINILPNEILIYIFSQLDFESIQSVEQVCNRWHMLAMSAAVWENMRLVLCMKNYEQIRDNILPKVASNLKVVKLQYFKLYNQIRVSLTTFCPNITHLEISISHVEFTIFNDLKNWPELRFLSFRNSAVSRATDDTDRNYVFEIPFQYLLKLETLVLSNFGLTSTSLFDMLCCTHLCNINIDKMKNIPSQFLESLISSKLHVLRYLCIYGDTLTDDIMNLLSQCTALCTLHITTCKSLFDSSLLRLGKLKGLKSLKLRHGYFSTRTLITYFSNNIFEGLTFLSLSRCLHVSVQVVLAIKANAPKLTELSFYQCPFVMDVNFDRTEIEKLFDFPLLLDWHFCRHSDVRGRVRLNFIWLNWNPKHTCVCKCVKIFCNFISVLFLVMYLFNQYLCKYILRSERRCSD